MTERTLAAPRLRVGHELGRRDRLVVGMLTFFIVFNVALDLPLILGHRDLAAGTRTDWIGRLWTAYAAVDAGWIVSQWSLAQEGLNVGVTTLVSAWLIWAIARGHAYRHALQLALGSYVTYSVLLYYLAGHLSGYAGMREPSLAAFAVFYAASLPWIAAHAYMVWHSSVEITRRFRMDAGDR
jgi:hypothetical protein